MIRWAGMEILEDLDELLDPQHTALLLWEVTQGSVAMAFNGEALAEKARQLLAAARRHHVLTLFARQNNMRWEDAGPGMVRMRIKQFRTKSVTAYRRLQQKRASAARWVRGIAPREKDIVFDRSFPNAFMGTNFEWWLSKHAIKTVLLAGVALETGIDATARTAVDRGLYTVIVRDCVGSPFEDTYQAALASLERIFDVCDSTQIIERWKTGTIRHEKQRPGSR